MLMNEREKNLQSGESVEAFMARLGMPLSPIAGVLKGQTRTQIEGTLQTTNPERNENTLRVRAAVEEAIRMGIVTEEKLEALTPSDRTAYLLGSAHFLPGVTDPTLVATRTKQSEAELFQLMYLMQKNNVRGRLIAEGVPHQGQAISVGRILIPLQNGEAIPLQSPEMQEHHFRHPERLIQIIDELIASGGQGHIPHFYRLSSFPFDGAQSSVSTQKVDLLTSKLPRSFEFYKILDQIKNVTPNGENLSYQVAIHKGKTYLRFGGSYVIKADTLIMEGNAHVAAMEEWNEVDRLREQEMATYLVNTEPGAVPLAWMGAAHATKVAELLREKMNVHILTPRSSSEVLKFRDKIMTEDNREIPLTTELVKIAESTQSTKRA